MKPTLLIGGPKDGQTVMTDSGGEFEYVGSGAIPAAEGDEMLLLVEWFTDANGTPRRIGMGYRRKDE